MDEINGLYPTRDVNKAAAFICATGKEPVSFSVDIRNGKKEVYFFFKNEGLPLELYDNQEMLFEPIEFSLHRRRLLRKAKKLIGEEYELR